MEEQRGCSFSGCDNKAECSWMDEDGKTLVSVCYEHAHTLGFCDVCHKRAGRRLRLLTEMIQREILAQLN